MPDWNPTQYLQFRNERTRPSMDLVSRIRLDTPQSIIDIGCGPGNSTQVLVQRWPGSKVVGLDNSAAMIEQARRDFPQQTWVLDDVATMPADTRYDLVFSNAVLQWVPGHEQLVPRLFDLVNPHGALAVQIPRFNTMPFSQAIQAAAANPAWRDLVRDCAGLFTYHLPDFYYNLLVSRAAALELWETAYVHVLASHPALLDFSRSTALRPYLDRLPTDTLKRDFEQAVLAECKTRYAAQSDGKVLFPFHRMFFIAYK